MAKEKPVHRIGLGKVRAAIWMNTSEEGDRYYRTSIVRRYRKGEEWLESSNYSPEELPLVIQVAQMACLWMCEHREVLAEEEQVEL